MTCPPEKPPEAGGKGGRKTVATGGSPWYASENEIRVRRKADGRKSKRDTQKTEENRDTQYARHTASPPKAGGPANHINAEHEPAVCASPANHCSAAYEPAEGGRPPVAPCKRSAERSDARSAAWGKRPHLTRKPAGGGRMNGTGNESSCTKRKIRDTQCANHGCPFVDI